MSGHTLTVPPQIRTSPAWVKRLEWYENGIQIGIESFTTRISVLILVRWPKLEASIQRYTGQHRMVQHPALSFAGTTGHRLYGEA